MNIDLNYDFSSQSPEEVQPLLDSVLASLENQLNAAPTIYSTPQADGIKQGDIILGSTPTGNPQIGIFNGKQTQNISQDSIVASMGFVGSLEASGSPTTTQFPIDGNWGFYKDTGSGDTYIARNVAGVITTSQMT